MKEVPGTWVCDGCDTLYARAPLQRREIAHCPRCGSELARHAGAQHERLLPLTLASLVMFTIANVFPIVEIELRGLRSRTTLTGAVVALAGEGMSLVAMLVLATTLLFPLLQLLILLWLLLPLRWRRQRPTGFAWLVRGMQALRPWGMVEVFMLGVLVAIVKLSSLATVLPGPALWAFIALTVLLTVVVSFDPRGFWDMAEAVEQNDKAPA
ncbi:MAG: hypothetical protein JWQ88_173 [Rhodoferax sp.]|nr:hypothetical protein [Rhodoferax sp.]